MYQFDTGLYQFWDKCPSIDTSHWINVSVLPFYDGKKKFIVIQIFLSYILGMHYTEMKIFFSC